MGFLDSFERQVERIVGGAFAKTFTSGLHPIEIVAALKREVDARAVVASRTRIVAPHSFHLGLAEPDLARLSTLGQAFIDELVEALSEYARTRGYQFSEPVTISLEGSDDVVEGLLDVRSEPVGEVVWVPTLTWEGKSYLLTRRSTTIGRGSDSDLPVDARGVSRHHAEIRWDGKRAEVVDLGSTNGTKLDGARISRAPLPDACTLAVGQARILFQVVPQAASVYHALARDTRANAEETP